MTDFPFFLPNSAIFVSIFTFLRPISQSWSPTPPPPPPTKKNPHGSPLSFSIKNRFSDVDSQKPISDSYSPPQKHIFKKVPGLFFRSFRFGCLLKFEIKTNCYNVGFNAHSEKLLFFCENYFIKCYYDSKLFIYSVFAMKLEL